MLHTQLKFPRPKRDDRGQFRMAIIRDAGKKRAICGRKGAEKSVFGSKLEPAIGAYRGGAAAAARLDPTKATGFTEPQKIRRMAV